ncbi:MAG: hypothetical protein AAFP19_05840 [Bacteroidota bacterium]
MRELVLFKMVLGWLVYVLVYKEICFCWLDKQNGEGVSPGRVLLGQAVLV